MSGDFESWNQEPSSARSSHSAPPSLAKRDRTKAWRKNLLFWIVVASALLGIVWVILKY